MSEQTEDRYGKAIQAIEWCRQHDIDWAGFWMDSNVISFGYMNKRGHRYEKVVAAMRGLMAKESNDGSTMLYEVQTDTFCFRWHLWKSDPVVNEPKLVTIGGDE